MNPPVKSTLPAGIIVLIVVGSIVALAGIAVLLYFFVFRKNKIKKQIRDLDRRFQYLHALLIGQNAQYVKRLEIISRTNLLYVDIHTKFLKRFKEIRDKHDSRAQNSINRLKDLLDEKRFKQIKECYSDVKDVIAAYEKEVTNLNKDLITVIKPEEECRQASLNLKEQLRHIKQDYYAKQGDLTLVSESFDQIFEYIDSLFEEFENFVESAQYDDANNILPKIEQILREISSAMLELPNLCALSVTIIPDKIASLENAYDVMIHDDFPLHHLRVRSSITEMKSELDTIITKIKEFNLHGLRDKLDNMSSSIDEFIRLFEEERVARDVFTKDNDDVYRTVNTIERRFIKLCNTLPDVSEIFIINESHQNKINEIQNEINKLGALKRSLDTFIHSATKQPYSLLVNKMTELDNASKSIITEIDEFNSYLVSLKEDSEAAYSIIFSMYEKVKVSEKEVRDINVENITNKYAESFDKFYELINDIAKLIMKKPIDVDKVNDLVLELRELSNNILDNGAISQDYNMMLLAENAIIFANRKRANFSDIDELLVQAEKFFEEGDFEHSYIVAGNALKKVQYENSNDGE